jgi:hypothetical protein
MSRYCHQAATRIASLAVTCGLALLFASSEARAGDVTITISETGLTPVSVFFGSGLDGPGSTPGVVGGTVSADLAALNATLDALGYDFHFRDTLGGSSDQTSVLAELGLTGTVERETSGGDKTIQIDVSQNDYSNLATKSGFMRNAFTGNFTNAPLGNTQVNTTYFASSNIQDDTSGPSQLLITYTSTGLAPNSHPKPKEGGSSPDLGVLSVAAYSLTGREVITLGGVTNPSSKPTDDFTLSLTLQNVPEPASVALMAIGLPVVVTLAWLRRRTKAA